MDRLGSGGFTPIPSGRSGLLSHTNIELLEQLAEDPADTYASSIWLNILVPQQKYLLPT